jgi:hypothetical protein
MWISEFTEQDYRNQPVAEEIGFSPKRFNPL